MKIILLLALVGFSVAYHGHYHHHHHQKKHNTLIYGGGRNRNKTENALICDECLWVAGELKVLLEDKKMQHQIHDFLSSRICTLFSQYRGMCDMLIEEALAEFFQEVELWLSDSKKACSEIELCSGAKKGLREVLGGLTERGFERAMEKGDKNVTCEECRLAFYEFKIKYIENKQIQQEVRQFFTKDVCWFFFKAHYCTDIFQVLTPQLFTIVDKFLQDTKFACTVFGMCPAPTNHIFF